VIAPSIIATALHSLKPIFTNREHLIAFAFGIFHGLGFAGLLSVSVPFFGGCLRGS
jgi:hypothetical protein